MQATLAAAEIAQLNVLHIINEPTAAAMAFGCGLQLCISSASAVRCPYCKVHLAVKGVLSYEEVDGTTAALIKLY